MEALGRLSGGVRTTLTTPLAAIIGALELASARLSDPARIQRLLATAMQAAERGTELRRFEHFAASKYLSLLEPPPKRSALQRGRRRGGDFRGG